MSQKVILTSSAPGILGPMETFPATAEVLNAVAQHLLRGDHPGTTLAVWQREYLAASVSQENRTPFCRDSHYAAALACSPFANDAQMHAAFMNDKKMMELDRLARRTALRVTSGIDFEAASDAGATNADLHLVCAIASAFCMFNTYVKAVGNPPLDGEAGYRAMGEMLCAKGYTSKVNRHATAKTHY